MYLVSTFGYQYKHLLHTQYIICLSCWCYIKLLSVKSNSITICITHFLPTLNNSTSASEILFKFCKPNNNYHSGQWCIVCIINHLYWQKPIENKGVNISTGLFTEASQGKNCPSFAMLCNKRSTSAVQVEIQKWIQPFSGSL